MKRRYFVWFLVALGATIPTACSQLSHPSALPNAAQSTLTVSAAVSLRKPLEDLQQRYQQTHPSTRIIYNFGSSGSLQQQIEQGAPVDLFIAASSKQIDGLQQKKLIRSGRTKPLLTNQLVLITPKNKTMITSLTHLIDANQIALGEPKTVPAGQYAEESLRYYRLLDQVQPKLIYGKDVRQVLTYVETGNVDAGFVYLTDAKSSDKVKIVATISSEAHKPIVYPIAQLERSQSQEAENFVNFLESEAAAKVFKHYGFGTPNFASKL